jgi:hypothetical protein
MGMQDPIPTFSYVIKELSEKHSNLAYVHLVEPIVEEVSTQGIQTNKVRN